MTTSLIIAAAFAIHGVAMTVLGVRLPWSIRAGKGDAVGRSWLLGDGALAAVAGLLVWLLAGGGFMAAGAGFWLGTSWWPVAAWTGAIATLLAVGLWARDVPAGAYAGAALAAGTIGYLMLL